MQNHIKKTGPVIPAAGHVDARCVGRATGRAHAGVVIVNRNTWVIRGGYYSPKVIHNCRSRSLKTCATAAELRAIEMFMRKYGHDGVSITFYTRNETVAYFLNGWRNAPGENTIAMPPWYSRIGTTLPRLAKRIHRHPNVGVVITPKHNDTSNAANLIADTANAIILNRTHQDQTQIMNQRFKLHLDTIPE